MFWKGKILLGCLLVSLCGECYGADLLATKPENITKKEIGLYWERIKSKAEKNFGGIDLSVEIATGVYKRDDGFSPENYNGEIKVKVPIYSKEDIRAKSEKKREFLDKGAELLKMLEVDVTKIGILKEKEAMLKAVMMEEGVKSIEAYHTVREERMALNAEMDEIMRKLEVMVM